MAKKYKKIFSKKDKLRVRKSYYTFTQEYPKYIEVEKTGRRITAKSLKKAAVYLLMFFVLASASFFTVKVAVNISYSPIDDSLQTEAVENSFGEIIAEKGVKALYMPHEKIGDEEYIKDFIKQVKRKDCNSVVIDFKAQDGRLSYSSMHEHAIAGSCAVYDNDTARRAVDIFAQSDIAVIARLFCFSDNRVAAADGSVAVKYMNTDVNWLDGSDEKGESAWLNPYSKSVRSYIATVAKEVANLGVSVFILEDLQFPGGNNTDSATYPGEKNQTSRNVMLKNTLSQVKKAVGEKALVILSQTAVDAANGNERIYFGTMSDAAFYGIAVDTAEKPFSVSVDKKTDYISVLSMYSSIAGRFSGKVLIPIINTEEYSRSYLRAMKKSGFESYILFDENGEY